MWVINRKNKEEAKKLLKNRGCKFSIGDTYSETNPKNNNNTNSKINIEKIWNKGISTPVHSLTNIDNNAGKYLIYV